MTRIEELRALAETTANAARLHRFYPSLVNCARHRLENLYGLVEDRIMDDVEVRDMWECVTRRNRRTTS